MAGRLLESGIMPLRRQILTALAVCFVAAVVLLVLDQRLPFPSPTERILYDPSGWGVLFRRQPAPPLRMGRTTDPAQSIGGAAAVLPPLTIMLYRAKPGDTLSGIATRLGMEVDTISTFNRIEGRGVHNLTVGELVKIPSQDGIYLDLTGDFDEMCRKNKVVAEDVLAANALDREDLRQGMTLFFPGVQHTGFALALSRGEAVYLPLRGYESSPFGRRSDPFTGQQSRHHGVDIAAAWGKAITSGTDGRVRAAGWDGTLGNYVEVRGQMGFSYIYGHMSRIAVKVGDIVSTGRVLGYVGDTGYATGPHLHFEVRKNGVPQNPKYYMSGIR
jgi:murein DD-endopeptidase MepM/ murein hydrolase activator NlpD